MPKFRRKVTEVWAEQYEVNKTSVKGVCRCTLGMNELANAGHSGVLEHVHTIHNNQPVKLEPGDWILPEPDRIHFYPVKPGIFAATYDPVLPGEGFRAALEEDGSI